MDSAAWATEVSRSEDLSCRGVSRKARRTTERGHYTQTVMHFSRPPATVTFLICSTDFGDREIGVPGRDSEFALAKTAGRYNTRMNRIGFTLGLVPVLGLV